MGAFTASDPWATLGAVIQAPTPEVTHVQVQVPRIPPAYHGNHRLAATGGAFRIT